MTGSNQRPWERLIQDLHSSFTVLEEELSLLRDIDREILTLGDADSARSLEQVFADAARQFVEIHKTRSPLLCYVYLGRRFLALNEDDVVGGNPPCIEVSEDAAPRTVGRDDETVASRTVSANEEPALFGSFAGARTIVLCPMYSPTRQLLCVFLIADRECPSGGGLDDEEFQHSVSALVGQFAIVYTHYYNTRRHRNINALWTTFLDGKLSFAECFEKFAHGIPAFLPSLGPLHTAATQPQVQILAVARDSDGRAKHLVIRGTTGAEHSGTRIAIRRSICGLLIEQDPAQLPYFCDDPSKPEHSTRYKKYLVAGRDTRTELAVRLVHDGVVVGVLNLESEQPEAFSIHDIHAMLDVAGSFAPIVEVFEERMAMSVQMQQVAAKSTGIYLDGLAKLYQHTLGTQLQTLTSNIDPARAHINALLRDVASPTHESRAPGTDMTTHPTGSASRSGFRFLVEPLEKAAVAIEGALKIQSTIWEYSNAFIANIRSYGEIREVNLRGVIEDAITLAKKSSPDDSISSSISIRIIRDESKPSMKVLGSTLLKEHLLNIINNAILSIRERLKEDRRAGTISIWIDDEPIAEGQESQLNRSLRVRIRDNGIGADESQLDRLRRFEPETTFRGRSGHGFGLPAAERYIASIGGRMELDAEVGKFFEVTLHFQYDDEHEMGPG